MEEGEERGGEGEGKGKKGGVVILYSGYVSAQGLLVHRQE